MPREFARPVSAALIAFTLSATAAADARRHEPSTAALLTQMVQARVDDDLARSQDILSKLLAIKPESPSYRLEALRIQALLTGSVNEDEIRRTVDDLCSGQDARVCQQAQEIYSMFAGKRIPALKTLFAHERAHRYKEAVDEYQALFFGAPGEDALRLRFYASMLHIPAREAEAKKALRLMAATAPTDPMIGLRAQEVLRRFEVNQHAAFGLANIAKKDKREQAARSLGTALMLAPKDKRAHDWRKALDEAVYQFAIEKAKSAERAQRLKEAEHYYQRALSFKDDKEPIVLQLADLARRQKNFAKADRLVREALDNKPQSAELRRAALDAIYAEELETMADQYESAKNWPLLIYVMQKLIAVNGQPPALVGRLANAYLEADRKDDALALFEAQGPEKLKEPLWAYGQAVVFERLGQIDDAVDALTNVTKKTALTRSFLERLLTQKAVKSAQAKAARGELHQALRDLRAVSSTAPEVISLRADWASRLNEKKEALAEYERLFDIPAYRTHARISAAGLAVELDDKKRAGEILDVLTEGEGADMTISQARRAISVYSKLGRNDKVDKLFESHAKKLDMTVNPDYALFGKERADFLQSQGKSDLALTAYRQAFVNSGISSVYPIDDDDFTHAMLTPDVQDDWTREALRLHASLLYQNDNVIVTTGFTGFHDEGTPGYSDTNGRVGSAQIMMPAKGGTLTIISDTVHYNMGNIQSRDPWEAMTGTCFAKGCDPAKSFTKDTGSLLAAAWTNGTWSFDIGTTPIGFHYTDVTGSIAYNFDLGPLSITTEAYRRAKDASLLAYGGQKDPATGMWWGGVRRTGASISVSKDAGETFGFWGKASWEDIRGRNVARNSAWQVMATSYARVINKPNHELIPSIFMMLWGFEKDLSGYTFGQGGYYSPQQYVGFNVSINDIGRTENWAWRFTGTWGRSYAKTDGIRRYPLPDKIPLWQQSEMKDFNSVSSTSGEWSNGFQLQANLERRLGSHFSLGAAAGWSQAPDYDYRWALLYLRWYMKPWKGNLPMPVPLLKPYSTR